MKKLYMKMLACASGLFLLGEAKSQNIIFSENWTSGTFATNNWTFPNGQGNWTVGSNYTPASGTAPNAYFNYSPSMTNYTISLLSNTINATSYPTGPVTLSYLLQLNNFSTATIENFIVEYKTVSGSTWNTVAAYSSTTSGTTNWAVNNFTLNGVAGQQFQLRFTAYGPNSYNLNGWGLDNISVQAPCLPGMAVSSAPQCSTGPFTLTATGANNYTWTPGASNASSIVVTPSVSTVYTVASTNTVAGCTETRTVMVDPNPVTPTINVSGTPSICANSTITLNASGATTYSWSTGASTSSVSVSPAATTVYSVTGYIASCSSTSTYTVDVTNINMTANSASLCASTGSANISVNAVPGTTVNWYATSTPMNPIATGTMFATPVLTTTTTYYAQASNSTGALNSIFTTTASGNGSEGNMFDVVPSNAIVFNGVDMSISSVGTVSVEVWYRTGTFIGFESSNTGWTNLITTTVTSPGTGTLVNVSGFSASLASGQTYGIYVTTKGGAGVNYTNGSSLGSTFVSNSDLVVKEGKGGAYFSVVNSPRVFNGRLYYGGSGCVSDMTPVSVLLNWCAGINEKEKSLLNLNVYPNPTNGNFTVELKNGLDKVIEVSDLSGRVIKTIRHNSDNVEVNLDGYSKGFYFVKVISGNASETIKLIKE